METHALDSRGITRTTPPADLPAYLTVVELQAYLAIGRSAAYDYARQHGIRVGRWLRVPREVITRG